MGGDFVAASSLNIEITHEAILSETLKAGAKSVGQGA
jgi:hypothetical protein